MGKVRGGGREFVVCSLWFVVGGKEFEVYGWGMRCLWSIYGVWWAYVGSMSEGLMYERVVYRGKEAGKNGS